MLLPVRCSFLPFSARLAVLLLLVAPARSQVEGPPARFVPLRYGDPVPLAYTVPYFPGAHYDPSVPPPEEVLGQAHGSRLSHHAEIVDCFRLWAAGSPRVQLRPHGLTYEGRSLVHAVLTSPENHARLDELLADLARLADPRGLSSEEGEAIVARAKPVAWLGYSIHGDELSGSDAALALGYHLAASTDAEVTGLLDQLIVVIDPCQNPDGRERIVAMVEQNTGYTPLLDYDAMQRGRWPWGRGNHYLFDLNRDWMTGSHPETRGRWRAAGAFHPQLVVDAHEMGSLDTYLFYPQADPKNPYRPERLDHWQQVFGKDQAAAFDRHGWPYYTREWAEGWAPFYTDAWGSLRGAIGILYEQAGTAGFPLRDRAGRVRTYREAVHHQVASSLANLRTLASHGAQILTDFLAHRRAAVAPGTPGNERMFVLVPGRNPSRERELLSLLVDQGVEVWRTSEHRVVMDVESTLGARSERLDLPPGTLVVPAAQPLRSSVLSYLSFDVPLDAESLRKEREDLQREARSNLYDATAWSLPLLFDLEAYWCDAAEAGGERVVPGGAPAGGLERQPLRADESPVFAWVVDGADDASVAFAARALEAGLSVHLADEAFATGGRRFARGSLLVRRAENGDDAAAAVDRAAREAGVTAHETSSGRSPDEGPDLGGGRFALLERPRVAMLSDLPIAPDTFGHLWFLLDREVGLPVSFLEAARLPLVDLRRYNVLVIPPAFEWNDELERVAEPLAAWVEAGGTLIAVGNAATALLGEERGLSAVVRRQDVLEDLDEWQFAARRERRSREVTLDVAALWGDRAGLAPAAAEAPRTEDEVAPDAEPSEPQGPQAEPSQEQPAPAAAAPAAESDPDLARQEEWLARFAPASVLLRGLVDDRAWITAGCGAELPVLVDGSEVLLARAPVSVPVRLAPAERLRLSGLLWPEARERLAESAWLTVEAKGQGQVVLFAAVPGYRAQFRAGARLFANAVVYGPGRGASPPVRW